MVRFSCFHTHKSKGVIQPSCHPTVSQRNAHDDIQEILTKLDLKDKSLINQAPLEAGCCSADDVEKNEYLKKCWSLGSELEQVGVTSGGSSGIDDQESHIFQPYNDVESVKDWTGSEPGEPCGSLGGPNGPHDDANEPFNDQNVPIEGVRVPLIDQNGPHDEANRAFDEANVAFAMNENKIGGQLFNSNRTEQWVRDLQHCSSFEDTNELISRIDQEKSGPAECKSVPALEAVKNYVSSLSSTSTSAQLSNYGIVIVPFLTPFGCLKALNLSGNSIVKISSGVLPRGLHMLNLSKNNITAIEGLRELTRLRMLDLSYNRIFKIGHGLASCSSLKELYLAGNKINEVEGLHRLLKLHILDLRFNKISTAKCLGQLAANYNSLHAISLEGNPAQKNVGDEQLKKYLQSLLPNLAYYNRQQIRSGLLKDGPDRSTRLGISSGPLDRGLKGNHKNARKGVFGGQAVVLPRRSRGRLPPAGGGYPQLQYVDAGGRGLGVSGLSSMRRSRSEGTLGAL